MNERKARLLPALLGVALAIGAGCDLHDPNKYVLGPTALDDALKLEPARPSLPADGVSRVTIVATINLATAATNRQVTFTTTLGTLFGGGASGSSVPVTADTSGRATIELQSDLRTGTANVRASAGTLVRSVDIPFTAVASADVLTLSLSSTSPPADGASIVNVAAVVNQAFAGRQIRFDLAPLAQGQLTLAQAVVDATGRAVTAIRSPQTVGPARLTATLEGFSASADLTFVRALPDQIHLTGTAVRIKADTALVSSTATFTASLLRNVGKVSEETVVTFTAATDTGAAVGAFSDVKLSDTNSKATAVFHPGITTFRGIATVTASVSGTSVTGSATIEIVDP